MKADKPASHQQAVRPADLRPVRQAETRRRLPRDEREKLIIQEAVRFFAEVGFEGQTRALAQRLGVTQPLLYRYFPDKDALIDRVHEEVFFSRWNPAWGDLLRDRSKPLAGRFTEFYWDYYQVIVTPEWTRIFLFTGLRDPRVTKRFLEQVRTVVLLPLLVEARHDAGLPDTGKVALQEAEEHLAWSVHAGTVHSSIRRCIYDFEAPRDLRSLLEIQMHGAIEGLKAGLRLVHAG